jgi:hypothetical protein
MNVAANDAELDEASLIKLYMDLTGVNESSARNVYMFVNLGEDEEELLSHDTDAWRTKETEAQRFAANESPAHAEAHQELGAGLLVTEACP